ncbi:pleckstrin homology domain-containing family B member 2-like [Hippopotamus amphibius kiboko]|uniref:pleckstrin homology domain-containing family B member 2-like n=1 Tax=Hippopotamus amphibius kiboko TaxID=575201 RepID=UPI00259650B8|nr:pleckstrin homology domain-containing family B member 2-like [Hippopotamus amphibius kiboko]
MAFVKSGWLLRQSSILKRWKKNWFDLWSDGHLIYYDDQTRQSVEDKVHMPVDCINIRTGHECRDIQPPDGKPKDCVLQIFCLDGKTISLCAESTDDCLLMLHQPLSRHMAVVHTVVHTCQELKLSMLQMGRLMLYPTSTHMQDFMDNSLPTKSSFVSGIETTTVTWRRACWLEQPQAWP